MNKNLSCIFNFKTLFEATTIGIITLIIGKIAFNLTLNKNNNDDNNNEDVIFPNNEPYGINLTLFITGFLLHYIIEILGLNKWYCNGKC